MRGDKECPFSDVTKSGKVWRKVPESDARSVVLHVTVRSLIVCVVNDYKFKVTCSACDSKVTDRPCHVMNDYKLRVTCSARDNKVTDRPCHE